MLDGVERHAMLQQQRNQNGGRLDVLLNRAASLADGINENLGRCATIRETSERGPVLLPVELEHLGLGRTTRRRAAALTGGDQGHDAPPDLEERAASLYLLKVIEASIMFLASPVGLIPSTKTSGPLL
jgi:hypothetical protein